MLKCSKTKQLKEHERKSITYKLGCYLFWPANRGSTSYLDWDPFPQGISLALPLSLQPLPTILKYLDFVQLQLECRKLHNLLEQQPELLKLPADNGVLNPKTPLRDLGGCGGALIMG